ncbi:MAG: polysaccharide pyruvyl transferase family protein [Synergistaceae bacterium]|nr:polysaccharide pyruvyl transferase family protein [Synergistaceae bacterium]
MTKILEDLGFEVDHLCYFNDISTRAQAKMLAKDFVKKILASLGCRRYNTISFLTRERKCPEWLNRFANFADKYIGRKIILTSYKDVWEGGKTRWEDYDFAVVGSDQVWHIWSHDQSTAEYYYLAFMPREKRVAYAPSFGFSEFSEIDREFHKTGLQGFDRLSSREQEGCRLIKELTGADAELVADPTLLLNADMWRAYAQKPSAEIPERYVLCYFLGRISPEYASVIRSIAGGLPVVNLYNIQTSLDFPPYFMAAPEEFLYLVDHADFVCTDSFHGTAFSVNFGKNFLTFPRFRPNGISAGMFGRIDSILSVTGLMNHAYTAGTNKRPEEINYDDVYARLAELRKSSMNYLKNCLHVN